jgi:hypothetical protein
MSVSSAPPFGAPEEAPHLPQEVLRSLLERVPQTTQRVESLIGPIAEHADRIRDFVAGMGWIEDIEDHPTMDTIAAVDGANAIDSTYAGDFVSTLALAAEGLNPAGLVGSCRVHSAWSDFRVHHIDMDRLAKFAMVVQELDLLRQLPHDFAILDGSHQTPVIVINSALTSESEEVKATALDLATQFDLAQTLRGLVTNDNIVACPKADSSLALGQYIAREWRAQHGTDLVIPAADKVLAALVLEPGQMFKAFKVDQSWRTLHIRPRAGTPRQDPVAVLARALDTEIDPLRGNDPIRISYLKPKGCSTAVKVEFKTALGPDFRRRVATVLASETTGPHLQEPFCQFLADKWAKAVGLGINAQMHAVRLDLSETAQPQFLEFLIRSYRTYGR